MSKILNVFTNQFFSYSQHIISIPNQKIQKFEIGGLLLKSGIFKLQHACFWALTLGFELNFVMEA